MDHMVDTKSSTVPSRKRSSIAATRCSDSLSLRRSLCMDYAVDARSHAADQTSKRMCARDRPCTRMSFHTGRGSTRTCRRTGSLQVLAVQGGSAQRQSGVQSRIRRQVPGSGLWFVARVRGNLRMGCAARTLQRLWRQCHLGDERRNNAEDHRRHDANGGEEALESRSGSAPKILSRAHAEAKQTAHRLNTPALHVHAHTATTGTADAHGTRRETSVNSNGCTDARMRARPAHARLKPAGHPASGRQHGR